jgi:hypothetical protein
MAVARKSLASLNFQGFEQPHRRRKRTLRDVRVMAALPPIADFG